MQVHNWESKTAGKWGGKPRNKNKGKEGECLFTGNGGREGGRWHGGGGGGQWAMPVAIDNDDNETTDQI